MTRAPKKSETLEIRIPHETKQALMARSRAEGKPASEVVRGFIDAYLAEAACSTPSAWDRNMTRLRLYARPSMALFATLVAVGGVGLAVSPATALPDLQAAFKEADADGNGALSPEEFGGTLARTFKIGPAGAAEPAAAPKADKAQPGLMFVMRAAPEAGDKPVSLSVRVPDEAGAGKDRAGQFRKMDLDGDGRLNFDEFEAHHRSLVDRAFAAVDADKDGFLSPGEVGSDGNRPDIVAAFDRDADGRLSRQEFMAPRE
ncbi:EF-hand domain-containing protein [Aminobacter aminovorans]|uniref:EF-hand domain-containing protein n=1 Tax=Aminobacter aminovorans TaxID=83263 RepID=UPI002859C33D|nr:EF-hand domain-containing protein [Aminobacter aminovorans]MDR7219968.1 Ca2+-binding EF-hand superfamily protein [Aminobacter aminovorans]